MVVYAAKYTTLNFKKEFKLNQNTGIVKVF